MDDIVALITSDHARIHRLFADLEGAADSPARLFSLWTELAGVLLAHLHAVREICYLAFLGSTPGRSLAMRDLRAQEDETCAAVAEARLHETGSPLWWLAVRAARRGARVHIDAIEAGPLPAFRRETPERTRRALGRQWKEFMADASRDAFEEHISLYDYFLQPGLGPRA